MTRITAAVLSVALATGAAACSDRNPSGPDDTSLKPLSGNPPPGMVVSNPLVSSGTASSIGVRSSLGVSANTVAYVSAVPGTFPGAASVAVRNSTKGGASRSVAVIEGGFDPVGIEAEAGDELSLTVYMSGGGSTSMAVKVPPRRPPEVVRTNPPKGRTDVALNVQVVVVFSEPVDKPSATSSSVALLKDGNAVNGRVQVAVDGLSAEFIPDSPLQPETTYSLVINQGIRDLDGDALGDAFTVTFMTDGPVPLLELAFTQFSDRQIYGIRADGTVIQLTRSGGNARPVWSPDGQRIAFVRFPVNAVNSFNGDIYLMNADGSNVVRRTVNSDFWAAVWSPDGRKLAVSDEGIYEADIYVMSADDDGLEPVHVATGARSPSWSPDGRKIAFVRTSGDDGYHAIWLMNGDGTGQVRLTSPDDGGGIPVRPTWSPDGQRLAFGKCLGAQGCDVYTMNADGSDLRRITNIGTAQEAVWSPDGKWIATSLWAYTGGEPAVTLAYVPVEGGTPRLIASGGFHPSWRP